MSKLRVKTRQDAFACVSAARNGSLSGSLSEAYARGLREFLLDWVAALDNLIASTRWCNECGKRCSGQYESFDGTVCAKCAAVCEERDRIAADMESAMERDSDE